MIKKVAKLEAAARILILLMKLNKWKQIKAGYDYFRCIILLLLLLWMIICSIMTCKKWKKRETNNKPLNYDHCLKGSWATICSCINSRTPRIIWSTTSVSNSVIKKDSLRLHPLTTHEFYHPNYNLLNLCNSMFLYAFLIPLTIKRTVVPPLLLQ